MAESTEGLYEDGVTQIAGIPVVDPVEHTIEEVYPHNYDDANTTDKLDCIEPKSLPAIGKSLNITSIPESFDFGEVEVGTTKSIELTITADISARYVRVQSSYPTVIPEKLVLMKDELASGVTLTVTWTPTEVDKVVNNICGTIGFLDEWEGVRINFTGTVI